MKDPSARIEYKSSDSAPVDSSIKGDESAGGVRAVVSLQNSVGYRRVSSLQELIWIKKIHLKKAVAVVFEQEWAEIRPGVCWMVLRERRSDQEYDREEISPESQAQARITE